jgi:hypothetical protein
MTYSKRICQKYIWCGGSFLKAPIWDREDIGNSMYFSQRAVRKEER